jgi:hypothetical protein
MQVNGGCWCHHGFSDSGILQVGPWRGSSDHPLRVCLVYQYAGKLEYMFLLEVRG